MAHAELTSRAKFHSHTSAARDERARRRCSHRHHHAHRATAIVPICAARPEAARQRSASQLKIHAAAWNLSTLMVARHRSSSHSPAQAGRRTIALASGRRATLQFDRGLAGTQPIRSETSTRLTCVNATRVREERDGAAQRRETLEGVPRRPQTERTGRIRAASSCIRDRHSPAPQRVHARRHRPCPRDLIHLVLESRSLEHHVHWDFPFVFFTHRTP